MRKNVSGDFEFDVSVIGLGAMGAKVAATLAARNKRVAAWNRSPGKGEALKASGIHISDTSENALRASPVTILVLLNSQAARETLEALLATGALAERTIVNYSSGSAEENEELHRIVVRAGGKYIKGVIMAYPRSIGHPESYCIHAGDRDAFEKHRELLELLAGHAVILPLEEAYAFATAINAQTFSAMISFFEVVGAAQHMGLPFAQMARKIEQASRFFIADALADAIRRLEGAGFAGDQATIDVHAAGFTYIGEYMKSRGASIPIFDTICEVVSRAQLEGLGKEDIAATTKVFASVA